LPRFILYGGKGGVGKTTCAAARAVAEAAGGRRVLVVSTDPAHSLGDVLGRRLSSRVSKVAQAFRPAGAGRKPRVSHPGALLAVELDARRAFARWLARHRRPLADILEQGTWLDREDVDALLDLSIPGLDELVGLLEITRLSQTEVADLIVVDTAPTGHTLRLLAAPETVGAVARVLDALQDTHRMIRDRLARVGRPEASDRLIELIAGQAREMAARLRDRRKTTIHWVTLPEDLSVAETGDAVATLERSEIRVTEITVNRVLPDGQRCPMCDRRRALEASVVREIRKRFGRGRRVRVVAAQKDEPVGLRAVARLGVGHRFSRVEPARISGAEPVRFSDGEPTRSRGAESLVALDGAQLLFFGGKGGVGKTTVAAAAAVRLAQAQPHRRVLLMSTDPAHSLGDVFGAPVGDAPAIIPGAPSNLRVREVDADAAWAARRASVESALEEVASAFGADGSGHAETRVADVIDLAPPGVDEMFGVLSMFEARDEYGLIVVDTAPTGHALRLLAMPDTVREWVQALMRMLLKYRSVVHPRQLASELVEISRSIRQLSQMLQNPRQTRFVVVTRPGGVPAAETQRLLRQLRKLKLSVPAIVANAMTLSPGRCAWCRRTALAERRHLRALQGSAGGRARRCAIIQTPLSAPPPRGLRALEEWGARWIMNG